MVPGTKGNPVKRIRVLLARMPALLRDILHHVVESAPDMTIVGQITDSDLAGAAKRLRADAILVAEDTREGAGEYTQLLLRRPKLKVLAIGNEGRNGTLHEMRPQHIPLPEISAETIRDAIRGHGREAQEISAGTSRPQLP
jgi:chemotaxis response regulator CheB